MKKQVVCYDAFSKILVELHGLSFSQELRQNANEPCQNNCDDWRTPRASAQSKQKHAK
jgi:hypothetical protein